jgi:hypothetical protein
VCLLTKEKEEEIRKNLWENLRWVDTVIGCLWEGGGG